MTRQKTQATQQRRLGGLVRGLLHRDKDTPAPPAADTPRPRRSVRDLITERFGDDAYDKVASPSTLMAHALTSKPIYQGTVDKATVLRRRAANKRARAARRIHRQRASR
jgi:hypothetical protein